MLDRLLETGARPKKSRWGGTISVGVHGAIIALVVATSAKAGQPPARIPRDPTIFRLPALPDDRSGGRTGRGSGRTSGQTTTIPSIPTIDLPPLVDPTPASTSVAGTTESSDAAVLSEIGRGERGTAMTSGTAGAASDATVDVPVRALGDRAPAYPETLRAAGISGQVRVQFVVDTTGRAEPSSVRVIESSHELFTRAVLASLRQSRFTPGEVAGRRVRTLVERTFRFDIAGGAR